MSETLIGQIITGIVTIVIAFLGYLKLKAGQKNVEAKVDAVQQDVNGKMEKLLVATGAAKKAEGKEEQKKESETTATDVVQAIKDDPDIDLTKK